MSSAVDFLGWAGTALLAVFIFYFGKSFAQTEKILEQKRRAYETFLTKCPSPNEVYDQALELPSDLQRSIGLISVYCSPEVAEAAAMYFSEFDKTQVLLNGSEEAGDPRFLRLMSFYNRMIWEMRRDAMTFSFFAPKRRSKYTLSNNPTATE